MTIILPKDNPYLIGQEKAEELFLDTIKRHTLPHALLISGIEGIGKATFAYKIARFLLEYDENQIQSRTNLDVLPTSQTFMQIAGASNPNFKVIERGYTDNDEKKIIKAIKEGQPLSDDDLQNLKKSMVIKVDEVREIHEFLSKKSFDGAWRIVLIDSVDDLNLSSANAILKILEEPPAKSLLLLISHQPNKLLATIRSRCSKLYLQPLSIQNIAVLLRRYMPELEEKDVQKLAQISKGSIGKALNYAANNGLQVYENLQNILFKGTSFELSKALELADYAASDDNIWELTIEFILQLIADMVTSREKGKLFLDLYQSVLQTARITTELNMDKKHAMINIIYDIAKAM